MTRRLIPIAALVLYALAGSVISAQETTGTFLGVIHDPSGAPVPNAKVTATETGTGRTHTTTSDGASNYTLSLLPIGSYSLAAEVTGFKRAVQADVVLHLGENLKVNFVLELGAVTASVEVSATYTRVNTEESSMAATVGARDMEGIPVNGRNFNEFLAILPGTVSSIPNEPNPLAFNRAGASMSGTRPNHNNWSQDGIFNMDIGANQNFNDSVPIETIQELRVVSTNYDAQYGVGGGAQVDVVTKSGTNQFHGHFEEFFRNDKMDTRKFFSQTVEDWTNAYV
jgi:hypothetical protein